MNGRTAYRAYCDAVDWRSVKGEPLPQWEQLPQPIREAWSASAKQVMRELLRSLARRPFEELIGPDWEAHP